MAELDGVPASLDQVKALALTNYGHFTSMRVEGQRVRGLSLHLERLVRDCQTLFGAELDPGRIRKLVRHAVSSNPVVVRVTVFDSSLKLGHPGVRDAEPHVLVTLRPAVTQPQPPLRVRAVRYERDLPDVKHVGLFGQLWHRRAAQLNGYDDALFTDPESYVSEGPTWNIGFLDGDRILWPRAETLPGVTMALISAMHDGPVDTAPVGLAQVPDMQAVFATNAATGLRAISAIDNTEWTTEGRVLDVLRKKYADIEPEPL